MKLLNAADYVVIKAGTRYSMQPPVHVLSLVEKIERNESYIYWLQPKNGGIEDQFASININGKFYHLNSKLEKAIFRNVRLTKDFRIYETLADGTHKLRIPTRLLKEKIRTSVRASDCSPVSGVRAPNMPRAFAALDRILCAHQILPLALSCI